MYTCVYLDNFRGFSDSIVPLHQVNFLVGENSTGKTSFLEVLELFSNSNFWFAAPSYEIKSKPARHFFDLVSVNAQSKRQFTLGAIGWDNERKIIGMLVSYVQREGRPVPSRISRIDGSFIGTVDGHLWTNTSGEKFKTRRRELRGNPSALDTHFRLAISTHKSNNGLKDVVLEEKKAFMPILFRIDDLYQKTGKRNYSVPYPFLNTFVELAPIRTIPRRTYDAPQTEFSPSGEHTPYIIKRRLSNKSQAEAFLNYLEKSGLDSGLFKSVTVKKYGNGPMSPFEVRVVLDRGSLGLNNVGYGVSQALPLIVEMFVRPDGSTLTIQQPEVHLHPRAQANFGDLVAEISRSDDKSFFIETHSDFTIDRFRLNMRNGKNVSSQLLFFERINGQNKVTSIPIDKNGDLPQNQPDSYRDFFLKESLSLLT